VVVPSVQGSTAVASAPGPPATPFSPLPTTLDVDPRARLLLRSFAIPPAPVNGVSFGYPITFHPGTTTVSNAATIDLKFGEERAGVDIALQPVPTFKVAGRVDGPPDAVADLELRLLAEGLEDLGHGSEAATTMVGTDGRFVFLNVPAGTYTIDAPRTINELKSGGEFAPLTQLRFPPPSGRPGGGYESQSLDVSPPGTTYERMSFRTSGTPNYLARAPVTVAGRDEENVVVTMRRAASMTGRIVVDGDPAQLPTSIDPAVLLRLDPASGNASLGLLRSDSRPGVSSATFTIQGLAPEKYFLRMNSLLVIQSVRWQGRDYTDTPFDAATTQDFADVEVTITSRIPTLGGVVRDKQGAPVDGAVVVVFPADESKWRNYGLLPARLRSASTSNAGRYKFTTLPAGEYCVVAVPQAQAGKWFEADFFRAALAAASRITLSWGDTSTVDMTLSTLPGDAR
jgi:hypothetical protein